MLLQAPYLPLCVRSTNCSASLCKLCRNDFLRFFFFLSDNSFFSVTDYSERSRSEKTHRPRPTEQYALSAHGTLVQSQFPTRTLCGPFRLMSLCRYDFWPCSRSTNICSVNLSSSLVLRHLLYQQSATMQLSPPPTH